MAGAGETTADTALMAGGTAAVITSVVISMLIVADVTAGALYNYLFVGKQQHEFYVR